MRKRVVQLVLFKMRDNLSRVDGFRFINNLHTTARQLAICSKIVVEINNTQILKQILHNHLHSWSFKMEVNNSQYLTSRGKLTSNKKVTTAFNHYIELSKSLGLINDLNNIYSNTRLSFILIHFLNKKKESDLKIELDKIEVFFYFFQLLVKDADALLLILTLLKSKEYNQSSLQTIFLQALNHRLLDKQKYSSNHIKHQIGEKYRTINFVWKSAEKYSEHVLIPRCEWLNQLGLVSIDRIKGSTYYSLSIKGKSMVERIPILLNSELKDINDEWVYGEVFSLIAEVYYDCDINNFSNHLLEFGESLETAVQVIRSSNIFRIPLFDTMFFICLKLLDENRIVMNFRDIISLLDEGFIFNNNQYFIKNAGRINESYITIRPHK
jgi:hypothetical protein